MTNISKTTGEPTFHALEVAIETIRNLRSVVAQVRRYDAKLAQQIVAAASSVAANVAEGNRRSGRDRNQLFRIAAGSAAETRTHLRVAVAWGFIQEADTRAASALLDRELAMLYQLTR